LHLGSERVCGSSDWTQCRLRVHRTVRPEEPAGRITNLGVDTKRLRPGGYELAVATPLTEVALVDHIGIDVKDRNLQPVGLSWLAACLAGIVGRR